MKKLIFLMAFIAMGTTVSFAQTTHRIDITNTWCNSYWIVLEAQDACSGTPVYSDPLYVAHTGTVPVIGEFDGAGNVLSGAFTWAGGSSSPSTSFSGTWCFTQAHVYNPCGIAVGAGCTMPYDEAILGSPVSSPTSGSYEISSKCFSTTGPCDVCPSGFFEHYFNFVLTVTTIDHYTFTGF